MNDERLTDLEIKLSHQEVQIEKLEKVVFQQQNAIERLELTMKELVKTIKAEQIGPANQKPPHY